MKSENVILLKEIRDDVKNDAKEMDGKPFSGQVVAEALGFVRAQIYAIASILIEEADDDQA